MSIFLRNVRLTDRFYEATSEKIHVTSGSLSFYDDVLKNEDFCNKLYKLISTQKVFFQNKGNMKVLD